MESANEQLERRLQEAIDNGRKIEAVKMYREMHRVGLKEAKDTVESMASGQPADSAKSLDGRTERQIYDSIYTGRKIEAIRLWRQASGDGLKDSKDFVDALESDLRIESPERFAAAPRKLGCLTMAAIVATIAAAATGLSCASLSVS